MANAGHAVALKEVDEMKSKEMLATYTLETK
jgi:hypothetical protein